MIDNLEKMSIKKAFVLTWLCIALWYLSMSVILVLSAPLFGGSYPSLLTHTLNELVQIFILPAIRYPRYTFLRVFVLAWVYRTLWRKPINNKFAILCLYAVTSFGIMYYLYIHDLTRLNEGSTLVPDGIRLFRMVIFGVSIIISYFVHSKILRYQRVKKEQKANS